MLDWLELSDALEAGHRMPRAEIGDTFLYRDPDTLLSRSAWIDGLGLAVKSATIFPRNATRGLSKINGAVSVFADQDGTLAALIDFHLVTKWKTAGDSLLASRKLARPDSQNILIVGAGTVARSMIDGYSAVFPAADFSVWSRTPASAAELATESVKAVTDLAAAVEAADIVCCATMATEPVVNGDWISPGTHLDLIGAYRPDMREVDDEAIRKARLFVDSRATTIGHIGEVMIPMEAGVISENDILADYYDIVSGQFTRTSDEEITIAKNGGGAHLDLMTCRYILDKLGR
jgi:ornithine cyclodeaminase